MFGLTKREQRWKAEQQAMETFCSFTVALVREVRLAHDAAAKQPTAAAARTEAQPDEPKMTEQRALVGEPFLPKDSPGHSV